MRLSESIVEDAALELFAELGFGIASGPDIAPEAPDVELETFGDIVLASRLRDAITRLNPTSDGDAQVEAFCKITRHAFPSFAENNRTFHLALCDGVSVETRSEDGTISGVPVRIFDFDNSDNIDWLAVDHIFSNGLRYELR